MVKCRDWPAAGWIMGLWQGIPLEETTPGPLNVWLCPSALLRSGLASEGFTARCPNILKIGLGNLEENLKIMFV